MKKKPAYFAIVFVLLSFASAAGAYDGKGGDSLPRLFDSALLNELVLNDSGAVGQLVSISPGSGKDAASRSAAAESIAAIPCKGTSRGSLKADLAPDIAARARAIRKDVQTGNTLPIDELLNSIDHYQSTVLSQGSNEGDIKSRLQAIYSIWALGETGNPDIMPRLEKIYGAADDTFKINILISMGKLMLRGKADQRIKNTAENPLETEVVRAAAFEMLEELGQTASLYGLPSSTDPGIAAGDIIYAGGLTGIISGWFNPDLPIGHTGIFVRTVRKAGRISVVITDCVPDWFIPGGVRIIHSFKEFTHDFRYPYYGNRTTSPAPTAAQRAKIVALGLELGAKGLSYDITHISQKGPVKFDCVGYSEYIYEKAGLNPTEDKYETGLGWPLSPWEQFISVVPNPASASF